MNILKPLLLASVCCALAGCQTPALPAPTPTALPTASGSPIALADYPLLPSVSPAMQALYQDGLANGNRSTLFSKLGDCMTASDHFFIPIGLGDYALGDYSDLQATIDHFSQTPTRGSAGLYNSFSDPGLAAARGFNAASLFDPIWADPAWCRNGETPIACELRVNQPSFALVMFGTNDIQYVPADKYERYLRQIVTTLLANRTVPILSTFPNWSAEPEKTIQYNQIVVQIAQDHAIPLMNLYQALLPLPNHGVEPTDALQLTMPTDGRVANFSSANLQAGYVIRNLLALRSLSHVWQTLAQP
jgi:hypothetical protein